MTIKGFKGDSWIRVLILGRLIDIVSAYKQNLSRRIAMDSKGRRIIVCDAGTESIKCGFADSKFPAHIIPSMVGKRCIDDLKPEVDAVKDMMVGDEARRHCRKQKMNYPVDNIGIVRSWEDMKHLWDYAFGETKLNVDPKACKILLTEPPMYPMPTREKTIEIMFEDYQFEGVYIGLQPVLTLYARGLMTGVVIDCGDGSTYISPVYDGVLLPDHTKRLDIGGRDITSYLRELFMCRGYIIDYEDSRMIKEKLCYVGYNIEQEETLALETTCLMEEYKLPDGQVIKLGYERFRAPEALFQPGLIDIDKEGVAEILFNTLQAIDIDERPELYKHIVLCGGGTMFPGFSDRMEREIKQLYCERVFKGDTSKLSNFQIRIEEHEQPQHSVFVGGAVLAGIMKDMEGFWMTRQEYEEKGIYVLEKLGVKVEEEKEYFDRTDGGYRDYVDGESPKVEKDFCVEECGYSTAGKQLFTALRRLIPVVDRAVTEEFDEFRP